MFDTRPSCYHSQDETGRWVVNPMKLYRASRLMLVLNRLGVGISPYDSLIGFYEEFDESSDF